jgi:hypothetical protein
MGTGYDEDGIVDGLVCVAPPDVIGDDDDFVPNIFLSGLLAGTNVNVVGVQDFAIEVWAMPFGVGDAVESDHVSLHGGGTGGQGTIFFNHNTGGAVVAWTVTERVTPPGGFMTGVAQVMPYGWHHYVANWDRNANCTFYIDGVAVDAVAIGAAVADNFNFNVVRLGSNGASVDSCSVALGPAAFHLNTLLTAAQMSDSIRRKDVQNIAQTIGLYHPRSIRGATGWETARANIRSQTYLYGTGVDIVVPLQFAAPEGASGVIQPDESGTGNDLPWITSASYAPGVATEALNVLGADPFWK